MKFTVEIELGNDAMRKPAHVARALCEIADKVAEIRGLDATAEGSIRDVNGNRVGTWRVIGK